MRSALPLRPFARDRAMNRYGRHRRACVANARQAAARTYLQPGDEIAKNKNRHLAAARICDMP
jgi:hypothetical protein